MKILQSPVQKYLYLFSRQNDLACQNYFIIRGNFDFDESLRTRRPASVFRPDHTATIRIMFEINQSVLYKVIHHSYNVQVTNVCTLWVTNKLTDSQHT